MCTSDTKVEYIVSLPVKINPGADYLEIVENFHLCDACSLGSQVTHSTAMKDSFHLITFPGLSRVLIRV